MNGVKQRAVRLRGQTDSRLELFLNKTEEPWPSTQRGNPGQLWEALQSLWDMWSKPRWQRADRGDGEQRVQPLLEMYVFVVFVEHTDILEERGENWEQWLGHLNVAHC